MMTRGVSIVKHTGAVKAAYVTQNGGHVSKTTAISPISKFFGFKPNDNDEPKDVKQPICRFCKRLIPVKDSQTTNLHAHLKVHHPADHFSSTCRGLRYCYNLAAALNPGRLLAGKQKQARQPSMEAVYHSCDPEMVQRGVM